MGRLLRRDGPPDERSQRGARLPYCVGEGGCCGLLAEYGGKQEAVALPYCVGEGGCCGDSRRFRRCHTASEREAVAARGSPAGRPAHDELPYCVGEGGCCGLVMGTPGSEDVVVAILRRRGRLLRPTGRGARRAHPRGCHTASEREAVAAARLVAVPRTRTMLPYCVGEGGCCGCTTDRRGSCHAASEREAVVAAARYPHRPLRNRPWLLRAGRSLRPTWRCHAADRETVAASPH